jgi:thioredoxin
MVLEVNSIEEIESNIKGSQKMVLYMWAPWCGPCKVSSPAYKEISDIDDNVGVNFIKINVDSVSESASRFGVKSIPTFIIFKEGIESVRMTGFKGKEDFKKWLTSSLN